MAINCLWGLVGLLLVASASSLQSISKGLPSPPRNLYTTSYEFNKILHFTAANSTGGLPTKYTVYLDCTPNCTLKNEGSPLYVPRVLQDCESLKHVDGKSYQCDLASANLFVTYRATVCAINPLGNASASINFQRPDVTFPCTVPAKPVQPVATEVQPGIVRIRWRNQNYMEYLDITYFRLEYREEGSNENKTWPKDKMGRDTTVVIDNLNADTTYYFYVKKQFRVPELFSPFSAPAIVSLHTKSADPGEPPQALNCSKIKDDYNVTIVWVSWKAPSQKNRNGRLVTYNITYSIAGSKNKTIAIVNASQTNINLTIPRLLKRMQIYSVTCNNHGCSGISNSCHVGGIPNPTISSKLLNGNKTAIIVGVIVAIIMACIVVGIIYCCFCRKKKTTQRRRLEMDLDSPYNEMYDEPEDNEDEHNYDKPLV